MRGTIGYDLLPIGTIIRLYGGEKRMMIFGVCQRMDDTEVEYDYVGVLYPEGNIGKGFQYVFNHADIEEIYYRGFEDKERQEFIEEIVELFNEENRNDLA